MALPPRGMGRPAQIFALLGDWIDEPLPILRLELVRVLAPLAVLGFMSGRLAHADEWIGDAGFHVPDLGVADWRQPFYIPPLPAWAAWWVALAMVVSGLFVAAGFKTRRSAIVFACTLFFVALADRLAAFTVSKLSPVVMLVLATSPAGSRFGVDAWLRRKKDPSAPVPRYARGGVRFYQLFLPIMYCGSGIAKGRGDWLSHKLVLWTHLHDSYQTTISWALASATPAFVWTFFQALVWVLETFAPIWFAWSRTRTLAFVLALGMHAMIGLMFGPVKWFAMLMGSMLLGAYLPDGVIGRLTAALERLEGGAPRAPEEPKPKKRKKRRAREASAGSPS